MKLFIETFGCQMNFSDSEIVASILADEGYEICGDVREADTIFINTCSIRDNAELRVRKRLRELRSLKKKNPSLTIGILGCMAERLSERLFEEENIIDLIAGPDSYRELPAMLETISGGQKAANTILSEEETYGDLSPVRYGSKGVSAFISVMRGCQNYCSYCVVPYTRGKERSRDPESILKEASQLLKEGYKEITLLGQNVNSYHYIGEKTTIGFPELLLAVASLSDDLRIRFATSHPKDLSNKLIEVIATTPNICHHIHLPVQSGSSTVLKRMNRKYDCAWYLGRVRAIKEQIPDVSISTDIITGFCGETEEEHHETLTLMEECGFEFAFMFAYSERPGTMAAGKMQDNVPETIKKERLKEIIEMQQKLSHASNIKDIGKTFRVLVEGYSKRSNKHLYGRNEQNKVVVFPSEELRPGTYCSVKITSCTTATLLGALTRAAD